MRILPLLLVASIGCDHSALGVGANTDAASPLDLGPDAAHADLAPFCGDSSSARIEWNGVLAASPAVQAYANYLSCCESGSFHVVSAQIPDSVTVTWRATQSITDVPVTLDLSNLPASWQVTVEDGCDPIIQPGCTPKDHFDTGLSGTLTVARKGSAFEMSTCLSLAESPSSPHAVLHALRFWSPAVSAQ